MNSTLRNLFVEVMLFLLILPALVGCMPDAQASIISPNLGSVEATATNQPIVAPVEAVEAVAVPLLNELPDEAVVAGLPPEIADALASVDPSAGETLALTNGCIGCHSLDPEVPLAGPTWHNMGNRAVERAVDLGTEGPAAYLYESISNPNAYVVEEYQPNIMPANYSDLLSDEEFAQLISYILSQQEQ